MGRYTPSRSNERFPTEIQKALGFVQPEKCKLAFLLNPFGVSAMKFFLLFIVLIKALSAQNLQFVNGFLTNIVAQRVIPLANGNHVVIGTQTVAGPTNADGEATTRSALLIYSISVNGAQDLNFGPSAPATIGGNGNDRASDAAVDAKDNIWIIGATDSDDFPLVNAIVSQKVAYRTSGFVLELDPTGRKILFSSYLGGHQVGNGQPFSKATNLVIGADGNAYILGNTSESDFPITPGAFGTPSSLVNGFQGDLHVDHANLHGRLDAVQHVSWGKPEQLPQRERMRGNIGQEHRRGDNRKCGRQCNRIRSDQRSGFPDDARRLPGTMRMHRGQFCRVHFPNRPRRKSSGLVYLFRRPVSGESSKPVDRNRLDRSCIRDRHAPAR